MPASALRPLEDHKTSPQRANFEDVSGFNVLHNIIRDQFTLGTWLALGALVQVLLLALPIPRYYATTPLVAYLVWDVVGTALIMVGLRADPSLAKSLKGKYTALVPDEEGEFRMGSKGNKIAVLHLAMRNHHHLGMLAPGFSEIAKRAGEMFHDLEARAEEWGFLGLSNYTSSGTTTTNGELVQIMYFKSNEDVQRFANSELHRSALDWFNRVTKEYPHLGIMHELFEAPPGKWEAVYKNIEPTMLAATKHKVPDQEGNEVWVSPVREANKGPAATHNGRLA